jgi:hypothetical protein
VSRTAGAKLAVKKTGLHHRNDEWTIASTCYTGNQKVTQTTKLNVVTATHVDVNGACHVEYKFKSI